MLLSVAGVIAPSAALAADDPVPGAPSILSAAFEAAPHEGPPTDDGLLLQRRTVHALASGRRCRNADSRPTRRNLRRNVRATVCLINRVRRAHGVRSLRTCPMLRRAARAHNLAMHRRGFFAHQSSGGPSLAARLRRARYRRYRLAGENLGGGTGRLVTPRNIVEAWLASPGHRANMLDARYREIGVSVMRGWPPQGRRGATYTVVFGSRR